MSDNKKLKIKGEGDSEPSKKLVLKKEQSPKGLKIKNNSLPELNETPDPNKTVIQKALPKALKLKGAEAQQEPAPAEAPKGLKIKGAKAPQEPAPAPAEAPKGLKIKGTKGPQEPAPAPTEAPKGLKIKGTKAPQEPAPAPAEAPKGLKIKGTKAPQEPAPAPAEAPKGLKIKGTKAPQEPAPAPAEAPKGLKIKGTNGPQEIPGAEPVDPAAETQEAPMAGPPQPVETQQAPQQAKPAQGLTIKATPQQTVNPIHTPPPIQAPSFQAPATSTKPPPPMPTGYAAPPTPQPSVNPQGPVFPTQGQAAGKGPVTAMPTGEPAINPQGPVFPTQNQAPGGAGARPPGTMPPPTHRKGTSAPLSAIMGEVKAAKRIDPSQMKQAPIQQEPEVVKVKKPTGVLKDSLGNEFCLIPKGNYFIGIENEQEEVKVAFTLAKYPVTKEQYFQFIKEAGINYSAEELNQINKISPYPNCPAVMVSWTDAKNYCRWMREKTGEYYALPSLKEWEAAARSADGRIFPWGEGEPNPEIACFNDGYMEPQSTCSVDFFENNVSPYGCIGMIGNVMEWTLDSFEDERKPHILKGGSWMSSIDFCNNVTPCMSFPEEKRKEFFGFRLLYLPKELYEKYRSNTG